MGIKSVSKSKKAFPIKWNEIEERMDAKVIDGKYNG